LLNDSLSASTMASCRFCGTTMRVSDEQTWPVRKVARLAIVLAAFSMS
jgi:hypothetical protein